ncbi:unnamed protein product [Trichobilharzia szidati]|nr:unnamed protein product [Trichobilharzia szidati]CAH8854233.1 unnamed protein product [Trichobilharzia szidati]
MTSLPQTHNAIIELLELMRCDNCSATLHQTFTTRVCEHLLCPSCIPSGSNGKNGSSCPVCSVPVHPRDCQVHPQFSSLVLVARRLKKLTMNESQEKIKDSYDPLTENENINPNQDKNEVPVPQVVLKQAYSASRKPTPEDNDSKKSVNITYKRGFSSIHDDTASSKQITTDTSSSNLGSAATISPINYKPHYVPVDVKVNKRRPSKKVTKLPAYPNYDNPTVTLNSVNPSELSTSLAPTASAAAPPSPPPPSVNKSVASLPAENVQDVSDNSKGKAVSKGPRNRRVLKSVENKSESTVVPFASPEPSRLTDQSSLSPTNLAPVPSSVCLTPIDLPPDNENESSNKTPRRKSTNNSKKGSKKTQENTRKATTVQDRKSSSGFLNLLQKLRPNSKGESQLHKAAIRGDVNQARELLTAGLSPDVRDHAGWTPLHEAALRGHCEVAKALIQAGATVDIPGGPELETPLHEAIQNGQANFCQLLLDHGANPMFPNNNGITPVQLVDNSICYVKDLLNTDSKSSSKYNASFKILSEIREMIDKAMLSSTSSNKNCVIDSSRTPNLLAISSATTFKERRRLRPILLGTGLTRIQQSLFTRVANMIHARVVTSISPEVTHVITGALQEASTELTAAGSGCGGGDAGETKNDTKKNNNTNTKSKRNSRSLKSVDAEANQNFNGQATCPRTLKFLSAVLQGCWILSFDWIETCAHIKMRVEEEGFEVTGCSTAPMSGAPRRARLAREAGSLGLLHGQRICFLGNFLYPVPSREELTRLARSGGASVVFSREVCSPIRLARYAIESANNSSIWDLNIDKMNTGEESKECEQGVDESISFIDDMTMMESDTPSSLLVLYDPGVYNKSLTNATTPHNKTIYAIETVSKALNLIKPKKNATSSASIDSLPPPLQLVPCTWLLDCAAEYRLLPFPSVDVVK